MFSDIVGLLKSPVFWFGSVFVSLVISVVGNLITELIRKLWIKMNLKLSKSSLLKQREFEEQINSVIRKGIKVTELEIHSIYHLIWSLLFLLIIFLFIVLNYSIFGQNNTLDIIFIPLWLLEIYIAMKTVNESSKERRVIHEVRKFYANLDENKKIELEK